MFQFGPTRTLRRISLTPMIDVVFLLLIFFMLSARFGLDRSLTLAQPGATEAYTGPPRLVQLVSSDATLLNGTPVRLDRLPDMLRPLMERPEDTIMIQPSASANVQDLTRVIERLTQAGLTRLILLEAP